MRNVTRIAAIAAALGVSTGSVPAIAQADDHRVERLDGSQAKRLPLREQATIRNAWLKERLDTVLPRLMREEGVDMWVLVAREYLEDPVVATMLNAENMHARRTTILVVYDPGEGRPLERLTISRYGLGGLFTPAWNPDEQPDQWKALGDIIAKRDPRKIAVNVSNTTRFADGLTKSQHDEFMKALPETLRTRVVPSETLSVRWLETRTPAEMKVYPDIVRLAHTIIAEGFSDKVVTPGKTTTADVVWWYREKIASLGLRAWFQPSVSIARRGVKENLDGDAVIQRGDMLWTDFGITYLGLNTDTQHHAYVLREGETDAPKGLKDGLAARNAAGEILINAFEVGKSGNAVLAKARKEAIAKGLVPSYYSHPIGYHGHAAGPAIGFWDNQGNAPAGEDLVRPDTAWSIEFNVRAKVPEWGGQELEFRSEEDVFYDGKRVTYIDGRQSAFHLIGGK